MSLFKLSYLSVPDINRVMWRIRINVSINMLWSLTCLQWQRVQTCSVGYTQRVTKDYHWVYEYNGVYICVLVFLVMPPAREIESLASIVLVDSLLHMEDRDRDNPLSTLPLKPDNPSTTTHQNQNITLSNRKLNTLVYL